MSDEKLLDVRLCDLGLTLEHSGLDDRIARLEEELARKGLDFRPHFWISTDWFSPDGVPGVAIPFFVMHPRLKRLERAQMLEVEGGSEEWCMRLLRHETGHAIDNAFRLHHRKDWRAAFGPASVKYAESYQPKPYSKRYVLHLDYWYAQSHPCEDFAETFAVWLRPGSQWRRRYAGWPALRKLEYVDRLMAQVGEMKPLVRRRERTDSIASVRMTLREYYARKRRRYGEDRPDFYDGDLRRLFAPREKGVRAVSAARFLRRESPAIRRRVARWTGEFQYTIDQVLREMIDRARELDLVLGGAEEETRFDATVMLTVQTMNYLHGGHHHVMR